MCVIVSIAITAAKSECVVLPRMTYRMEEISGKHALSTEKTRANPPQRATED